MRFVGIDLAAQPNNTSACVLEWRKRPRVVEIRRSATDDWIISKASQSTTAIGIDSPFGWPISFVNFIHQKRVARHPRPLSASEAIGLKYRITDIFVRNHFDSLGKNIRPISVSTDKLGAVALRCARLVQCLEKQHGGQCKIFEVYPAASLACWMTIEGSYKSNKNAQQSRENRAYILGELEMHGVDVSIFRDKFVNSDDDLDALVSALTAAVAFKERTYLPSADTLEVAKFEGWIHIPCGSLEDFSQIAFEH